MALLGHPDDRDYLHIPTVRLDAPFPRRPQVLVLKEGLVEMLAADLVSQANASGMGSAGFTDKTDSSLSNSP